MLARISYFCLLNTIYVILNMCNSNYLYLAIRAAVDAGKAIMDIYNDPNADFGIEQKADNSPLTKADKAAHGILTNVLSVTLYV